MEKWTHPKDYGGFSPDGDYCLLARNRDSDILSESNWAIACKQLKAEPFDGGRFSTEPPPDSRPAVYHWRAGHWACGWIEYLMIRADARPETIAAAEEIADSLEQYPVLDDEDFSNREYESACELWEHSSIKERVELLQEHGGNIFQARHDYLPKSE